LGAGTGIFSLFACQFGASLVHAVEPDESIRIAKAIAAANGFSDRITFHQRLSTAVSLPGRADVIISDLRGILPQHQQHLPAIADARKRLLASGGSLIGRRDTLWAALVENPKQYRTYDKPWVLNDYDLDMSAGHSFVVNTWCKVHATSEELLTSPRQWATVDYHTVEDDAVEGEVDVAVNRAGTAHGVVVWFDAELADGIGFSNAPGQPELIYGQAFFPLTAAVPLAAGARVRMRLAAKRSGNEYVWLWDTEVRRPQDRGEPHVRFRQSSFFGVLFDPARLHRREMAYLPRLDEDGEVDRYVLSLVDGKTTIEDIARRAARRFPSRFPDWKDALTCVGELAERYSW